MTTDRGDAPQVTDEVREAVRRAMWDAISDAQNVAAGRTASTFSTKNHVDAILRAALAAPSVAPPMVLNRGALRTALAWCREGLTAAQSERLATGMADYFAYRAATPPELDGSGPGCCPECGYRAPAPPAPSTEPDAYLSEYQREEGGEWYPNGVNFHNWTPSSDRVRVVPLFRAAAPSQSQPAAEKVGVLRLYNRADGVSGHYCIGRLTDGGYHEFWNAKAGRFASAGTVYTDADLCQPAERDYDAGFRDGLAEQLTPPHYGYQPAAPQPETREPPHAPTLRPGSWMCFVCHGINGAGVKDCCGHCRPVSRASAPEGDAEPPCDCPARHRTRQECADLWGEMQPCACMCHLAAARAEGDSET